MYPKKSFRGRILEMLLQKKTFCKGPFVKSVTEKINSSYENIANFMKLQTIFLISLSLEFSIKSFLK